jgi:hypothetical protein
MDESICEYHRPYRKAEVIDIWRVFVIVRVYGDAMTRKIHVPVEKYSQIRGEESGDIHPLLIPPPLQKEEYPHCYPIPREYHPPPIPTIPI